MFIILYTELATDLLSVYHQTLRWGGIVKHLEILNIKIEYF